MRTNTMVKLAAVGIALMSSAAYADTVTFAGYPAPGGNSFLGAGLAINPGGLNGSYSGFNTSAYTNLYWVIDTTPGSTPGSAPFLGTNSTGSGDTLTFNSAASNLPGGVLAFQGTDSVPTASGTAFVFTELLVKVTNTSSSPLALDDPSLHTGMLAGDGGALNVAGAFNVNFQFLAGSSYSTLTDAKDYWSSLNTVGTAPGGAAFLYDSFNGGFYSTPPAAVPLPAAAWLLLSALGGMGLMMRRRSDKSAADGGLAV